MRARSLRWVLLPTAAVCGALVGVVVADRPAVVIGSYLAAVALVVVLLESGAFNVRLAGRISPTLTLPVALLSYATTAILLVVLLAVADPSRVSGPAVALGLVVATLVWVGTELAACWVPRNLSEKPVNIRPQDARSPTSRLRRQ